MAAYYTRNRANYSGLEVGGGAKLRRALNRAADNLGDLTSMHKRVAEVARGPAASRAPRDSGALEDSLVAEGFRTRALVRSRLRYAGFVHWGTQHLEARPFALEAVAATQPLWLAVYDRELDAILRRVAVTADGRGA